MNKSQLVFVPCPGMGHLIPTIEFAKLLINHDHRFSVTVLIINSPFDATYNAYVHSLVSSPSPSFPTRLHLTLLPSTLPTNISQHHKGTFLDAFFENHKPHFREAVSNLESGPDSPPLAGFVVDMFCSPVFDVADEFGVPAFAFFPSGAAYLGFLSQFYTLMERRGVDTTAFNFKDSGMEFAFPSFLNAIPAKVFPLLVLEKGWESFSRNHARLHKKARGIIVNTFEELESHAVLSFSSNGGIPVYPVGPILSIEGPSNPAQQGFDVIKWLDDQPPSSVLFLCFGSLGYFDQVESGFLDRTAEVGIVIGWAPQAQILAHGAIGGFVSHCGWNTILESIYFGVPVATWPLTSEQQINAFHLVRELKIGVEISLDYRTGFSNGSKTEVLGAERIEKGMRDVMAAKENEIRRKVKDLSEKSRRALAEDGSSYINLGRFIDDIMNMK
ncbi:anthocyanidin 3-O-glucosyltransferase 2-like [Senna tora]|uniref:Glycosyltransferase n=1 Tax=Senna tora TaxID=362788 RepID=A0A834U4A7_9FABA|nr:anthocyanidin 3-O-glucosyltransferase 2-like [Senna tora]